MTEILRKYKEKSKKVPHGSKSPVREGSNVDQKNRKPIVDREGEQLFRRLKQKQVEDLSKRKLTSKFMSSMELVKGVELNSLAVAAGAGPMMESTNVEAKMMLQS